MATYLFKLLTSYRPWTPITFVNTTSLHESVRRSSTSDAYELIKNGVDVNFKSGMSSAPIYDAIYYRNSVTICLLLYYGADLEFAELMRCGGYRDPSLLTASNDFREITKIVLNYCSVGDEPRIEDYCQDLLTRFSLPGAFLINNGHSDHILVELFLTIVSKINPVVLLNFEKPFLLTYLQSCDFATVNWLKCLYTILEYPHAADLVQHVTDLNGCGSCFLDLILAFENRNVERRDRIAIIWTWLSLGAVVTVDDTKIALQHFGYGEELEALIYGFNSYSTRYSNGTPSIIDILSLEDNHNCICSILSRNSFYSHYDVQQTILKTLKFFALSNPTKQNVLTKCQNARDLDWTVISENLKRLDDCASLAELSRNQVRKAVKQAYVIRQPYHFFEIIKSLNIPLSIKDIILFKEPLY